MAWFEAQNEIAHPKHPKGGWQLVFQWGAYVYDDKSREEGYRFIWKRPNGSIQPRGPARIPSIDDIKLLIDLAEATKWGGHRGP